MPDLPFDAGEIRRALLRVRHAIRAPAPFGDTLPRAIDQAGEVTAAINRLTDEVARLNANVEELAPVFRSIERQVARSAPVLDSVQGLQQVLRRTMGARPGASEPVDRPAAKRPPANRPVPGTGDPGGGDPLR